VVVILIKDAINKTLFATIELVFFNIKSSSFVGYSMLFYTYPFSTPFN